MAEEHATPDAIIAAPRARVRPRAKNERSTTKATYAHEYVVADLLERGELTELKRRELMQKWDIGERRMSELVRSGNLIIATRNRPNVRMARSAGYVRRAFETAEKRQNPIATAQLAKAELDHVRYIEEARGAQWIVGLVTRMHDRIQLDRKTSAWLLDELVRQIDIEERSAVEATPREPRTITVAAEGSEEST